MSDGRFDSGKGNFANWRRWVGFVDMSFRGTHGQLVVWLKCALLSHFVFAVARICLRMDSEQGDRIGKDNA